MSAASGWHCMGDDGVKSLSTPTPIFRRRSGARRVPGIVWSLTLRITMWSCCWWRGAFRRWNTWFCWRQRLDTTFFGWTWYCSLFATCVHQLRGQTTPWPSCVTHGVVVCPHPPGDWHWSQTSYQAVNPQASWLLSGCSEINKILRSGFFLGQSQRSQFLILLKLSHRPSSFQSSSFNW